MYSINVPQVYLITKNYDVKITPFKGTKYGGDINWIAEWFYTMYDNLADNVIFHIRGDFHITYPNPPHLSVKIEYPNGYQTNILHLSRDQYGKGFLQELPNAGLKIRSKKRVKKHKRSIKKHKKIIHKK